MTPATRRAAVIGTAMLVAAAGSAHAQTSRLDADGNVREDAYIRIPLSEADQRYATIDGARLKDVVREVADISLANRDDRTKYWGRIAGTRGEEMAREYVERRFRELGLTDIRDQVFDLPTQWFPAGHDIRVEAGGRTYRFDSMVPALRSNPTDGTLDLEAVWVGTGSTADFLGRDVAGKAVFIHSIPAPGSMGHSAGASWEDAIRRAQDRGAAAVVVIYGISDNFTIWQSLGRDVTIPGAFMGYEDGNTVKELIGGGETVRVSMRVDVDYRDGLKTASVFGTLPGTTDEDIYVLAHLDGYFEAALDNASGIAVMLALAEHFAARPASERRRNLVFVGTAGHHVGSPGSRWMHDNRETALADAALMINCEHVSVKQTVYWGPLDADDRHPVAAPVVGERQRPPRRPRPRRLPHLRRRGLGPHGGPGRRRDGQRRARPAVGADHPLARDQAHRPGHPRVGARGRPRGGGPRLRAHRRRRQRARPRRPAAGADDRRAVGDMATLTRLRQTLRIRSFRELHGRDTGAARTGHVWTGSGRIEQEHRVEAVLPDAVAGARG